MQADHQELDATPPIRLDVGTATRDDIAAALRAGVDDFKQRPGLSMAFGLVFALLGFVILSALLVFDQIWIAIAAGVGFPLVAPFLAAGLYDMSRRLKKSEPFTAADVFLVVFRPENREFGWMAFVVLFVFWLWAYQIRILLAIFLQWQSFTTLGELIPILYTTLDGIMFLGVGSVIGAFLSTVLFSVTVISMPLLLDKNVDFVTAMITSVKTVLCSPVVMLGWGATIGVFTLLAILPVFLGVVVIVPILGHATWHLYERLISEI